MNFLEILIALILVALVSIAVINFESIYSKLYFSNKNSFETTLYLHNALLEKLYWGYVEKSYRKVKIDIISIPNLPNPFYRARLDEKSIYEAR